MMNVTKAFEQMHEARRKNIAKSFGINIGNNEETEMSEEKKAIIKGLQSENPFERELAKDALEKSEMSEIEKSDIMDAIAYSDNFKIKKSGKEIKENLKNIVIPKKQTELTTKKAEADEILKSCGAAPTCDVCRYWTRELDIDCGYKRYDWEETYYNDREERVSTCISWEGKEAEQPKFNCPTSKEEADARRKYNDKVQCVCDILVDIYACDILDKNLDDKTEIALTPRQLVVFGFN